MASKRQRTEPTGGHPSGRVGRLDLTICKWIKKIVPKYFILPFVSHIAGYVKDASEQPDIEKDVLLAVYRFIFPGFNCDPLLDRWKLANLCQQLVNSEQQVICTTSDMDYIIKFIFRERGIVQSADSVVAHFDSSVTSKYKNKVLVRFSCRFDYSSTWKSNEIWPANKFNRLGDDLIVNLGSIDGKHSEVERTLRQLVDEVITDPCEIYKLVQRGIGNNDKVYTNLNESDKLYHSSEEEESEEDDDDEEEENGEKTIDILSSILPSILP